MYYLEGNAILAEHGELPTASQRHNMQRCHSVDLRPQTIIPSTFRILPIFFPQRGNPMRDSYEMFSDFFAFLVGRFNNFMEISTGKQDSRLYF